MAAHKGAQCSQMCLLLYTLLFWLSGFALIFLALWALLDPRRSYVLDLVNFAEDEPLLRAAVYVSILTGCITLVVGFIACCGAIKKSRCMIVTLVIFLTIILCAEITIGVLAICYRNKFAGNSMSVYVTSMTHNRYNRDYWVTPLLDAIQFYVIFCLITEYEAITFTLNDFDVKLQTMIRDDYGIRLRNERNAHITSLIDRLQFYEECCGSQNASNWNGSRWQTTVGTSSSSIEGDLQLYSLFNSVPATCCVQLTGATPVNPVARSFARCQQPEASKIWRHQSGCHEKLLQWLDVQTTIFASVGFSFAIFQMIGVCTALSLFRHAHGYHYVRA